MVHDITDLGECPVCMYVKRICYYLLSESSYNCFMHSAQVYSCIHGEKQSGLCLLHFTQN